MSKGIMHGRILRMYKNELQAFSRLTQLLDTLQRTFSNPNIQDYSWQRHTVKRHWADRPLGHGS